MQPPRFCRSFLAPRYWLLWVSLGLLWLLVQLPYPMLLWLGRQVGAVMYRGAPARRRIAERNLELCFPQLPAPARRTLLRENFASTGIAFFEMAISWWWPAKRLARLGHIEGMEHVHAATRAGQGIILMAAHFTTLEIGAALMYQRHPGTGVYRRHRNAVFDYVQRVGRERHGPGTHMIERDDARAMVSLLRTGHTIWYAPDQDYGAKHSVFVPLFGIPAATVTATRTFARLGRARVLPFTQQRLPDGAGYRLVIHPPLENFPSASETDDCRQINQWLEDAILRCPEQYLWAHRRFKTRPPGEPSLYATRG